MTAPSPGGQTIYPLSIIVLNWNLPADTLDCIASLQRGLLPGMSIVLVDNGSTDDSLALFRQHLDTSVAILPLPTNVGFAAGMNAGIAYALQAGAQSVLLLNNDTIVDPQMLCHLAQAAEQVPGAALLGPVIYYYDEPLRIWHFADNAYRWLPIPLRLGRWKLLQARGKPFPVDYVTACAVLIRRAVLETTGLLDPSFFMYFEDADFCWRARRAGFQIWCVPRARMWHRVSRSARKDKPLTRYTLAWGRAHFYRQCPHGPAPALTLLYLLGKLLLTTLGDIARGDGRLIAPLWRGTFDGYTGRPPRLPSQDTQ